MLKPAALAVALIAVPLLAATAGAVEAAAPAGQAVEWTSWRADNDVRNSASLQRGARNFANYCRGCHSLKYMRYSRMAGDLHIPEAELQANLIPAGDKPSDYMLTSMAPADGEAWFGKAPPDLSLIARARGADYLYRFLKTFYADPGQPSGSNNLQLPNAAMPAVLSELEGVKRAVYAGGAAPADGKAAGEKVFDHFETTTPGTMDAAQFDAFVRDTVNFLDYVGEPVQTARVGMGVWVVLFLLVFTLLAWLLKREYWKDVH